MANRKKQTATKQDQPARRTRRDQPEQRDDDTKRGGKSNLNRVGALWLGDGRNGKFMSGRIELSEGQEVRILVFKNNYKEESKHPDYIIYEPEQEQEQRNRSTAANDWKKGKGRADYDDDIPF